MHGGFRGKQTNIKLLEHFHWGSFITSKLVSTDCASDIYFTCQSVMESSPAALCVFLSSILFSSPGFSVPATPSHFIFLLLFYLASLALLRRSLYLLFFLIGLIFLYIPSSFPTISHSILPQLMYLLLLSYLTSLPFFVCPPAPNHSVRPSTPNPSDLFSPSLCLLTLVVFSLFSSLSPIHY